MVLAFAYFHFLRPFQWKNWPILPFILFSRWVISTFSLSQGGLKLKISALKVPDYGTRDDGDYSSDSSESRDTTPNKSPSYDAKSKTRKLYASAARDEVSKNVPPKSRATGRSRFSGSHKVDYDSDSSSSSSNASPIKKYPLPTKARESSVATACKKLSSPNSLPKGVDNCKKETKGGKGAVVDDAKKKDVSKTVPKERSITSSVSTSAKFRSRTASTLPNIKVILTRFIYGTYVVMRSTKKKLFNHSYVTQLPQTCKLSEDSDDNDDGAKATSSRGEIKKENNRDTIESLAQQLTNSTNPSEHLQVRNIVESTVDVCD